MRFQRAPVYVVLPGGSRSVTGPCARTREALAGRSRPPPVIEHQHLLASTLPLAHQRCAGLQLRADPEPFGLLQPQPDLAEVTLHLNAQPTRGDFLDPTVDRTHQQLRAEARPSYRSRLSRAPACAESSTPADPKVTRSRSPITPTCAGILPR